MQSGQTAFEFLGTVAILALLFIIFSVFVLTEFSYMITQDEETVVAKQLAEKLTREIETAYLAGDGYQASFYMPQRIGGNNYSVYYNSTARVIEFDIEDRGVIDQYALARYIPPDVILYGVGGGNVHLRNSDGTVSVWGSAPIVSGSNDTTPPGISIATPLNQSYNVTWVWGNVTLDETGFWCGYSLDGAANQTMSGSGTSWYSNVTSLSDAQHSILYSCNDTAGNMGESSTRWFTVDTPAPPDTTAPTVTLTSPTNTTYGVNYVWVNATTNESAAWCGYSLDGAANQTMSGSGTSWYYNATDLSEAQHYVNAYCNDSSGNMGSSTTRWFTTSTAVPWWNNTWQYRKAINIIENSGTNLAEYQVMLDMDTEQLINAGKMESACEDIRFVDENNDEIAFYTEESASIGCDTNSTDVWVQVPTIASSSTTSIYMYYGKPGASSKSDKWDVFNHSSERAVFYPVGSNNADNANVISFRDSNTVKAGTTTLSLNEQGMGVLPNADLNQNTPVYTLKPAQINSQSTGDAFVPISFAGTSFVYRIDRGTNTFYFYAPFGDAKATIYRGVGFGSNENVTVTNGTVASSSTDIPNDQTVWISSNASVLVFHQGGSNDNFVLHPESTEWWGVPSNYMDIGAKEAGTSVTVYWSDGTTNSQSMNAGDQWRITAPSGGGAGTEGDDATAHVVANKPIGAVQIADSDGSETTTFLPEHELGKEYYVPQNAQYITVAATQPDTNCLLYNSTGGLEDNKTSGSRARPYPNKLYFGSTTDGTNINAGAKLVCDELVYAYYEYSSTNDEHNLWSLKANRQYVWPAVGTAIGTEEVGADVTPPVITIVSPANTTYYDNWAWMNITLDESGDWAGYSLDGAANQTMSGSGTTWYYNASMLDGSHYVTFYANDSSGNMGESSTRWFFVQLEDFKIQRGYTIMSAASATATITAGVDYGAPAGDAFIRLTNTRLSGMGRTSGGGSQNADDFTVYISNPENLGANITFTRHGTVNDNRVAWEIVEYIGAPGGGNEFKVRNVSTVTFGAGSLTADSPTVSNVSDDNDLVVFITGQGNPDTARSDINTGICTSEWVNATDVARFTRGETGSDATDVSYAVVEFTGSNWGVQRVQHQYSSAGAWETESITALTNTSRTFLHTQHRSGSGLQGLDEQGEEAYILDLNTLRFQLQSGSTTPSGQYTVAWVVENTQTGGRPMGIQHMSGSRSSGTGSEEDTWTESISSVVMNRTSIVGENARSSGTGTYFPRGFNIVTLSNSTTVELKRSDNGQTQTYRYSVVEWPAEVGS